eukprot:TRINITY_DN12921_c0_g1_i1.p1 TRINITY_DN12921_c0_g1~~TRINITY_DN12921_c0_g1_i1.p1  ORF type:complete len:209 (-),score=39.94 TRINITY_DN12921_c0_g1_i1:83-709(-)
MYVQRAIELIRELQATTALPPYQDEKMRQVMEEMIELYEIVLECVKDLKERETAHNSGKDGLSEEDFLSTKQILVCRLAVHHEALARNKRCVLAYLNERLNRIRQLRWEVGRAVPKDVRQNMSSDEIKYLSDYSHTLTEYLDFVNMDLTVDSLPPKTLLISVRVLKEFEQPLMTSSGPVALKKNTVLYLKRGDAEPLIKQGVLQHVRC